MAKKLPCGCELGHTVIRLCHVAKELWAAYEREYYAASKASPEWENQVHAWATANAALKAYQEHFRAEAQS